MSKKTPKADELPRYWKRTIRRLTGLHYCDRDCGCGENNQLWWFPVTAGELREMPEWLEGWMNGGDTSEIWEWLAENGRRADHLGQAPAGGPQDGGEG